MSDNKTLTLDEVIQLQEQKLANLKSLRDAEFEARGTLDRVHSQMTAIITDNPFEGKVSTALNTIRQKRMISNGTRSPLHTFLVPIIGTSGNYMRIKDLAQAALDKGYQSNAKNFYANVMQIVRTDKKHFKMRRVAGSAKEVEVTITKAAESSLQPAAEVATA